MQTTEEQRKKWNKEESTVIGQYVHEGAKLKDKIEKLEQQESQIKRDFEVSKQEKERQIE